MIIAAYAAAGKSAFAAQTEGAIDLLCMPYKWILPPVDKAPLELESEKGALYHLHDPRYPDNYIAAILRAEREHQFVVIPTDMAVVRRLQEDYDRKVVLCYPEDSCKEEYRERFVARGNSESFLEIFIDGWDRFLRPVRENERGVHIVMGSGEYLMDLRPHLEEEWRTDTTQPAAEETICTLEEELAGRRKDQILYLSGDEDCRFYPITDLDAPEEREFLYRLGKMVLGSDIDIVPMVAHRSVFRKASIDAFQTADREAVMAFVEKYKERQTN